MYNWNNLKFELYKHFVIMKFNQNVIKISYESIKLLIVCINFSFDTRFKHGNLLTSVGEVKRRKSILPLEFIPFLTE